MAPPTNAMLVGKPFTYAALAAKVRQVLEAEPKA